MPAFLFILVVALVNGSYLWLTGSARRRERRRLWRRLSIERPEDAGRIKAKPALIEVDARQGKGAVDSWFGGLRLRQRLEVLLERSGNGWTAAAFMRRTGWAAAAGGVTAAVAVPFALPWSVLLGALLAAMTPSWLLRRAVGKRLAAFEVQFPSCLEFISRSMRAGHAFSVAMESIPDEFRAPLATEFKRASEEHSLGMPLDTALQRIALRVPLESVHFFVCAVTLQKKTGGNLAEILEKLAEIVRERFKLKARVKVISAHGRMTAVCLAAIPVGVAGLMFLVNRPYMAFFFTEDAGHWLIATALILQVTGYAVISRLVRIEV